MNDVRSCFSYCCWCFSAENLPINTCPFATPQSDILCDDPKQNRRQWNGRLFCLLPIKSRLRLGSRGSRRQSWLVARAARTSLIRRGLKAASSTCIHRTTPSDDSSPPVLLTVSTTQRLLLRKVTSQFCSLPTHCTAITSLWSPPRYCPVVMFDTADVTPCNVYPVVFLRQVTVAHERRILILLTSSWRLEAGIEFLLYISSSLRPSGSPHSRRRHKTVHAAVYRVGVARGIAC